MESTLILLKKACYEHKSKSAGGLNVIDMIKILVNNYGVIESDIKHLKRDELELYCHKVLSNQNQYLEKLITEKNAKKLVKVPQLGKKSQLHQFVKVPEEHVQQFVKVPLQIVQKLEVPQLGKKSQLHQFVKVPVPVQIIQKLEVPQLGKKAQLQQFEKQLVQQLEVKQLEVKQLPDDKQEIKLEDISVLTDKKLEIVNESYINNRKSVNIDTTLELSDVFDETVLRDDVYNRYKLFHQMYINNIKYYKDLETNIKDALDAYKDYDYQTINAMLIRDTTSYPHKIRAENIRVALHNIYYIDSAFKSAPKLQKPLVVYKGSSFTIPNNFVIKNYISTSINLNIAQEFAEDISSNLYAFILPEGLPYIYLDVNSFNLTNYPQLAQYNEKDQLLPAKQLYEKYEKRHASLVNTKYYINSTEQEVFLPRSLTYNKIGHFYVNFEFTNKIRMNKISMNKINEESRIVNVGRISM